MAERSITVRAPINIAVIKYWGKRDAKLNLPLSPSLSCTLDSQYFGTTTTVFMNAAYQHDRFWLNGKERPLNDRLTHCIAAAKYFLKRAKYENRMKTDLDEENYHLNIVTQNDGPTAAGLASSASGYAALAYALIRLYNLDQVYAMEQLSVIARVGSGSACRSLFGGFVTWQPGELADGMDSTSHESSPPSNWPELQALILVLSDAKEEKWVPSTAGMQRTVSTSSLFPFRLASILPDRIKEMIEAVKKKSFSSFARLTMQDSNQFHALCLDTYPPICYLNDASTSVIHFVSIFNESFGIEKAAYTFDAGPHAVIYLERDTIQTFLALLVKYFDFEQGHFDTADTSLGDFTSLALDPHQVSAFEARIKLKPFCKVDKGQESDVGDHASALSCSRRSPTIFRIVHCSLGTGPQVLPASPFDLALLIRSGDGARV